MKTVCLAEEDTSILVLLSLFCAFLLLPAWSATSTPDGSTVTARSDTSLFAARGTGEISCSIGSSAGRVATFPC